MNIIGHKWIYLGVSSLLVLASIIVVFGIGLAPGIDFTGGTLWQMKFENPVAKGAIEGYFSETLAIPNVLVSEQASGAFMVRLPEVSEPTHQEYTEKIKSDIGAFEEQSFESIGPAIGAELQGKAKSVVIAVMIAISLYIAFAFRKVSYPVSSWKYGAITLVTLFHDVMIAIGFFTFLGYAYGAEIDISIIVALLVVMGFSVHDTIVVFDRIRENLRHGKTGADFSELVNRSVNETIARSINTSLTLVLVLLALYFFGAASLGYFVLTILVGTVVGTYSSIFVASPLLTLWRSKTPTK